MGGFPADWMSQLHDREAGEMPGLYMPLRNAGMRLVILEQPMPDRRGTTLSPNQVVAEPSAGNHQISRDVFSVPAYPASGVLESLSSMGAYRNGIYSPSTSPASLS